VDDTVAGGRGRSFCRACTEDCAGERDVVVEAEELCDVGEGKDCKDGFEA